MMVLLPISASANIIAIELIDQQAQLSLNLQIDEDYEMQTSTNLICDRPVNGMVEQPAMNRIPINRTTTFIQKNNFLADF